MIMELNEFIKKFQEQFENEKLVLNADTYFKELDEWTSLMGISIIAMVDDEYNISISGSDIRNSDTIEDLFDIVKSRADV